MDVFLASGNEHKFQEFHEMLPGVGVNLTLHSANEAGGMPEVDENGETFEANALLKAEALVEKIPDGAWVLADDSGLVVDALGGAPGVHSARFAGPSGNAAANNLKLLHELETCPMERRTARFRCVLAFIQAGGASRFFEGSCEGIILPHPTGDEGFGYDPLFQPSGYGKSFAELSGEEKNKVSHRGKAVQAWITFLKDQLV